MKVTYIAQYANIKEDRERFVFSPGGVAKMDYFLYCLQQLGIETSVYSSCLSKKGISTFLHGQTIYGQPVRHAISFKPTIKGSAQLLLLILQIQLFVRLLFSHKNEIFLVYHERFYAPVIKLVQRIRKLKIIIDVEEIYSIHAKLSTHKVKSEISYLKSFTNYTLANISLVDELNLSAKQYAICNGVYAPILSQGKTHNGTIIEVLYAGTFDKSKGGALAAINAFNLLDNKYRLYVCGFGTDSEIKEVKKRIDEINSSKGHTAIIYEGFIANTSHRFAELLSRCRIGLSTQNNVGQYNATSFPSKIFEYMRHGIKVVSTLIPGSENLPVSKSITFIASNTAENIADGIKRSAMLANQPECDALCDMHHNFINKFKELLLS